MALLERLEIVIEADARTAEREFERIGKSATESLESIETAAGKVGNNASAELAGASSKFAAAGRDLSDAAAKELDLSAAAQKAAADVPRALDSQKGETARSASELSDAAGRSLDFEADAKAAAGEIPKAIDNTRSDARAAGGRVADSFGDSFRDGVDDSLEQLNGDVGGVFDGLTSSLTGAGSVAGDATGSAIGQGVTSGLAEAGVDVAAGFARSTDELVAAGGGIGEGLGGNIAGGVVEGLASKATDISDSFLSAAGQFPAPAILAAGVAVGALLAQGVGDAIEMGAIESRFEAALGVNEQRAGELGALAGRVYAGNFGESVAQVAESIRLVDQNFAGVGDLTEAELQQVNEAALTTAAVFDQDLRQVINATAQLIRTGLAKDATEAFDIITAGLQGPANKADDLLDTFNEYSTLFRDLGLDGEQALGLINQMVEAGARDSDVAADSLKEFSIRAVDASKTTADGFALIGLNAEEMAERIAAGGGSASGALDETLDRLRDLDGAAQDQAGVALFGTQWEDLGAAILAADLDTAATQLGEVDGKAAEAAGSFDDLGSKVESLKREVQTGLGETAEGFLAPLAEAASSDASWSGMKDAILTNIETALDQVPFGDTLNRWGDMVAGSDMWANIFGGEAPEPPQSLKDILADVQAARANVDPILDLDSISAQAPMAVASLEDVNREIALSNDLFDLAGDRASNYLTRIGNTTSLDDMIGSQLALRDATGELVDGLGALQGVDIEGFAAGTVQVSDEAAEALGDISGAASAAQQQIADTLEYQGEGAAVAKADELRDGFVQMFEAAGMTDEQIIDLLASMGLLPEQVTTAIELSGADEALAKLDLLQTRFEGDIPDKVQTQIDVAVAEGRFTDAANLISLWVKDQEDGSIDDPLLLQIMGETAPAQAAVDGVIDENTGREIWLTLRANVEQLAADMPMFGATGSSGGGTTSDPTDSWGDYKPPSAYPNAGAVAAKLVGLLPGRATGGPVMADAMYQVNEMGGELFAPSTPGFVMDAGETRALIQGVQALIAGGATGLQNTQYITTADPMIAASESARKMRDAQYLAGV